MSVQVDSEVVINCENASVEEVLAAIESAHLTSPIKLSKEKGFAGADIGTSLLGEYSLANSGNLCAKSLNPVSTSLFIHIGHEAYPLLI